MPRIRSLDDLPIIIRDLRLRLQQVFGKENEEPRQIMCFMEEAGEFLGAWRRSYGWARRAGDRQELIDEFADVLITIFMAAEILAIDPVSALEDKLEKIYTRGWREVV